MAKTTFKYGGIHPHDFGELVQNKESEKLPQPSELNVSIWQHVGKPALAKVQKGDALKNGDIVAEAQGFVSANIHAGISGKVGITAAAPPPLGRGALAVQIKRDENAEVRKYERKISGLDGLSKEEIVKKVQAAGVVGLGGAMFPTHVKLSPPADKPIDTLIINAVECEPYINSDYRLMLEKTDELFEGVMIIRKVIDVKEVLIGIESNTPMAIEIMKKKAAGLSSSIKVVPLKTQYPQGGEKQLIQALTGREVPAGGLPMDVGVVVQNTATLLAIYEAVYMDKPLTERLVTVSGQAVKEPKNLWVPVGTRVSELIDYCGGITEERVIVINGGPMMGFALPSLNQSTVKGTNSILVLPDRMEGETPVNPCIRCARCVSVCPIGLMPRELAAYSKVEDADRMHEYDIMSCIECGSCSYACPSKIPLVQIIRVGKNYLRNKRG